MFVCLYIYIYMRNVWALPRRCSVVGPHSQSNVVATLHSIGKINKGIGDLGNIKIPPPFNSTCLCVCLPALPACLPAWLAGWLAGSLSVCLPACLPGWLSVCLSGWLAVCLSVHVCTCMYMYVHVCTCMYMYVHVCTCMYMYVHVCIRMCVCMSCQYNMIMIKEWLWYRILTVRIP